MKLNNFTNYTYLIYAAVGSFCVAWAVSGWLTISTVGAPDLSKINIAKPTSAKPKLPDTSLILDKNIFKVSEGEIISETASAAQPGEQAAPVSTTFKGNLLGVLKGDGKSMAVVEYDGENYILTEGVEQKGLTLIETGYYDAVIRHGGKDHKLVLEMPDPAKLNQVKTNHNVTKTPKNVQPKAGKGDNVKISRQEVMKNLSDVNVIIKSVLIVPFEMNGEFQGYRVRRMARDSVLKKLGIKRNDVIMRLNGKSLESPTVFFDTLKNAENLSAITIDILRANKRITNYVEIEG